MLPEKKIGENKEKQCLTKHCKNLKIEKHESG